MRIEDLKGRVNNEIIESLSARGIGELTPPQSAAIDNGLLDGRNIVVAAPTASGKTIVAEIACMVNILSGKKAVYIAPMRALVTEKYNEFVHDYPYIKTAISIGDMDSTDPWMAEYDMMFVSTEKFDSLIRHKIDWLGRVGCVIFDEVHMIGEVSRGPTLELVMTRIREFTSAQIIALSATVGNSEDIAEWLDAELVVSDYRPVKLVKGVLKDGRAYMVDKSGGMEVVLRGKGKSAEILLLEDTLNIEKQLLIFYATKRNAEAGAGRIAEYMKGLKGVLDQKRLEAISRSILNTLDRPTKQCERLSECVKAGVAFHHSGLVNSQRGMVEEAFRNNEIKVICSTTTLGLGVNLPAHTVLVKDMVRYNGGGTDRIGVNEVMQLFGRAGRPKYDHEGRAFLSCGPSQSVEEVAERYINADPEPIYSALGVAPVLRTHILSFVSTGLFSDRDSIHSFLAKSFYSFQYGERSRIESIVDDIIDELIGWGFIGHSSGRLVPTKIGVRISELYIDPLSAKWIIDNMGSKRDIISELYVISNTVEMRPYARPLKGRAEDVEDEFLNYLNKGVIKSSKYETSYGFQDEVGAFATAKSLYEWVEEKSEESILLDYNMTPGALYAKVSNADWMLYSWIELSKLVHNPYRSLINTRVRLRYGIREELLDLVRLEQIGRVRARRLYDNGIKSVSDIRANVGKVERLLGKEVSKRILSQVTPE